MIDQHRSDALVCRDLIERDALGRSKSGRAAVAQLIGPFHVPVDFVLRYAEVMLQGAAHPERSGLLVFADTNSMAGHVARLLDSRIDMIGKLRMKKAARREH